MQIIVFNIAVCQVTSTERFFKEGVTQPLPEDLLFYRVSFQPSSNMLPGLLRNTNAFHLAI